MASPTSSNPNNNPRPSIPSACSSACAGSLAAACFRQAHQPAPLSPKWPKQVTRNTKAPKPQPLEPRPYAPVYMNPKKPLKPQPARLSEPGLLLLDALFHLKLPHLQGRMKGSCWCCCYGLRKCVCILKYQTWSYAFVCVSICTQHMCTSAYLYIRTGSNRNI